MEGLLLDLRQAARALVRQRAFSTVAVIIIAAGVAANLTVFSIVDGVVLAPLPFESPDELVFVGEKNPGGMEFTVSEPTYLDFRDRARSFESLGAFRPAELTVGTGAAPERVAAGAVSAEFFRTLGVEPERGRTFTDVEDRAGVPAQVAVIGHGLAARLGGAAAVVSRSIPVDGRPHTVVGVMPEGFGFADSELWVPLGAAPGGDRGDHWLWLIGRLVPGATEATATAELAAISEDLAAVHPVMRGWGVTVEELSGWLLGDTFARAAWVLMGAVVLLLVLACANVANLLLVRGLARRSELAVRTALGAGRLRLLRHLIAEGALLAAAGTAVGLLVTVWLLDSLRALDLPALPSFENVTIGFAAVALTAALALALTAVFGLTPLLQAGRIDLSRSLRGETRSATADRGWGAREALILVQVSLALVLLVGSGLLLRSLVRLEAVDPGFDTHDVVGVRIELPSGPYGEGAPRAIFVRQALARMAEVPGVVAVGASSTEPLGEMRFVNDVTPADRAAAYAAAGYMQADWRGAWPGYFETIGLPVLDGRTFTAADRWNSPPVVILTQTLADRLWPGERAVGRQLYWGGVNGDPYTVVGVVGDLRDAELDEAAPPLMFVPMERVLFPGFTLFARTEPGAATSVGPAIRAAIRELDDQLAVPDVLPLEANRDRALAEPRFNARLLTAFSGLALLLAAIGIYAVMSFTVGLRRRELAIRVALGAEIGAVSGLVLGRALRLALAGLAIGAVIAAGLARLLGDLLYEVTPSDAATWALVPAVLLLATLLAAWLPARRAATVQPAEVLRHD